MSKCQLTSDPRTMDLRLQANPQLHYGVNKDAVQNSRPGQDNALQFLSPEEQECLQFFKETIDSLEETLEENDQWTGQVKLPTNRSGPVEAVDRPPTSSPNPGVIVSSVLARPPSPKDQDIIDLVHPEPDLVQTKKPILSSTSPDFPESHFEIKPRCDQVDSFPSEYNPPLPRGSYGSTDSHSSYHPPGCIPTPVLIAQKIAENQAGTSNFLTSSLRRCSLESDKPPSNSVDLPVKQGPPTSAKPNRFPANISVILGSKEHQNQSLANVNIHERRAQMLANLPGSSHPLLQEYPQPAVEQNARNTPSRSISFKDPSPDKSRMEALSKLGLTRNRAMSGGVSLLATSDSTSLDPLTGAETSAKPLEAGVSPKTETSTKFPEANLMTPHQSQIHVDRKPEILRTDSLRRLEDRNPQPSPPAVTQSSYYPPPLENKASVPPPPEVTSLEFNSYGGKSIMVNPSVSSRSEPAPSPTSHEPKILPPALANPSEFNTYGGKTKVMIPAPVPVTRSDLPDILSSHINKSQTLPTKSEPLPTELNNYGGKSRTIDPSTGLNRPSDSPARSFKAPAPTPAPRPPRHSYHGSVTNQKAAPQALSPKHKRERGRSSSMFRPQGITVQFSGRGATDASRREALRKLGLMKDS
ncbi:specifically androgen-regulated gene protein [Siniperca chuatsi]|uniref:specifically androgen-regulated gene protein n=1 Tax=Siniperca chuatsi TaxID=119488 RepID=UPI001CE16043|nr:specifically androgen-regulated gene protein [Siniperca chuatsi]XP_044041509.1 specifically androgen-regulated gene protein [Siniperca chuatsi]